MYPAPSATDCQIATFRQREMMETGRRERRLANVLPAPATGTISINVLRHRLVVRLVEAARLPHRADGHMARGLASPGTSEQGSAA